MRYYLTHMARSKQTPPKKPLEVLRVCTVKLTPAMEQTLRHVSQDASDALGWTVTSSAVMRALLLYIAQRPVGWRQETLFPLIEQEITQGRVWGSKKRE